MATEITFTRIFSSLLIRAMSFSSAQHYLDLKKEKNKGFSQTSKNFIISTTDQNKIYIMSNSWYFKITRKINHYKVEFSYIQSYSVDSRLWDIDFQEGYEIYKILVGENVVTYLSSNEPNEQISVILKAFNLDPEEENFIKELIN